MEQRDAFEIGEEETGSLGVAVVPPKYGGGVE